MLTLLGDAFKGWLPVWIAQHFAAPSDTADLAMALAGALAVIGHMYPVFHRFQGGKGVATALGVLLGWNVYIALGAAATWIIIAVFFRISSLAALIAAAFVPFAVAMLYHPMHPYFFAALVISALIIYRHKANIQKLLAGTESRIGR